MSTHYPSGPWLRVVLNFSNDEKGWENILWYRPTGSIPVHTNVETVAADVNAALKPSFIAAMPVTAQWLGVDVYLNNGTYTVRGSVVESVVGSGSENQLPTEDAVVVAINSGTATREGVGRIFVGGVDEDNVENSRLTSAGSALYVTMAAAMMALVTAGDVPIQLAVWSRVGSALFNAIFAQPSAVLGHRRKRRPRR